MDYLLYFLVFCIGATFGSFFTLAVYRIPIKQDITHTRSYCPKCAHKLSFIDMIPILSYVCLGGKCRYCKEKIRPRYILLEILSGLAFVLFSASIKFSVFSMNYQTVTYFGFGLLYLATLFIIAGIDKERIKIEKPVLLFGFICVTLYMIYLYIVENDASIYRYVIYLLTLVILTMANTIYYKKKVKNNYTLDCLILLNIMLIFTYEYCSILTVIFTLLAMSIKVLIDKINQKRANYSKTHKKLPIGFFLCVTNIITLITTNCIIFYKG